MDATLARGDGPGGEGDGRDYGDPCCDLLNGRRVPSIEGPHLVTTFKLVGLETNTTKMQVMTCTPGNIRLQLPTRSYQRMRTGRTSAANWDARTVTSRECGKDMRTSFLRCHLADLHEIYQQQVVAEELLDRQEGVVYEVPLGHGTPKCPFPLCKGELASGWLM
jgi:muramoyltetrapeptide carboxypeptidase LdcA involved in peptidoglycan recycling